MNHLKYFHTYETHAKLRWKNKSIIDVLTSEFSTRTREYYLDALRTGVITVNNSPVSPSYKLKDLDLIRHTIHSHEPLPPEIKIIKQEEDFWVVNKPAGIPCHPTGGYFEYSVTRALFRDRTVGCVNRLDMPVSGVLIITLKNSDKVHGFLRTAEKIYVAKVKGVFPAHAEVNKPIGLTGPRMHDVSENGKPSMTIFRRLLYKDGFSLVECRPVTGRTHQIRIHIKDLGFPIINDIIYGSHEECEIPGTENGECNEEISSYGDREKFECIIRHCKGINNRSFRIKDSFICLHAWKYKFNGSVYEAKLPEWAMI